MLHDMSSLSPIVAGLLGSLIPETHQPGIERPATFSLVLGFIVMMLLDVTLGG
jgi:zinc transporter ZupT